MNDKDLGCDAMVNSEINVNRRSQLLQLNLAHAEQPETRLR